MVVVKASVSQFLCYSPVAVSAFVFSDNGADFFFQFCVFIWFFLLLGVVIICAEREAGNVQQQRQLVWP